MQPCTHLHQTACMQCVTNTDVCISNTEEGNNLRKLRALTNYIHSSVYDIWKYEAMKKY